MRVTVDPALLSATSAPLRRAAEVAHEMPASRRELASHADYAGSPAVRAAIEDFLQAWGDGLGAAAAHGETLARMLDLAASAYTDADHRAHRHASGGSV